MSIETLTMAARAAGFAMAASEELLELPPQLSKVDRPAAPKTNEADAGTMLVTRVQPSSSPGWWAFWKAPA